MRRAIIIIVAIAVVAVSAFFIWRSRQTAVAGPVEFDVVREAAVARGTLASTVSATGSIEPEALVSLSFGSGGTVQNVLVARNQRVEAGTLLATLDADELALAVQQAEDALRIQELTLAQRRDAQPPASQVAASQADIDSAQANLTIAEANAEGSQADIASARANLAIAQANYDGALADVDSARTNLTIAQANGRAAQLGIESAEANLNVTQSNVSAAQASVNAAQASRNQVLAGGATQAEIAAARADVLAAEQQQQAAQDFYDDVFTCYTQPDGFEACPKEALQDSATTQLNIANASLEAARSRLANLQSGVRSQDIAVADANIASSQAQVTTAQNNVTVAEIAVNNARTQAEASSGQVQVAQANVRRAEASARALQGQIAVAQANVDRAEASARALAGQVEVARANVARAQAAYDTLFEPATEQEIAILEAQVAQARTSLESAQLRLEQSRIVAPIGGVVASVQIATGEQASPGAPVFTILNAEAYHLEVNVDEIDIELLAVNQPANITLDAIEGRTLQGFVSDIAPVAAAGTGVVTYLVTVNITDDGGVDLRAGLTATANIVVNEVDDVLVVPNWAVRVNRETGEAFVNVQRAAGTFEEVTVQTGLRNEQFSEVLAGLEEGDTVVITNQREAFSIFGGGN